MKYLAFEKTSKPLPFQRRAIAFWQSDHSPAPSFSIPLSLVTGKLLRVRKTTRISAGLLCDANHDA